jgi:Uma2 family endonuclease
MSDTLIQKVLDVAWKRQTSMLPTEPRPRLWTAEEFYLLLDQGFFLPNNRVELIEGEIIDMPAQKNYHGAALTLTQMALLAIFGEGYWVRPQLSLDLSPISVVDPDIAVIRGDPRTYSQTNPTSALLIVEVSDSTLSYNRNSKASLYARSGVADYWIVNLVDRQLEVYRNPVADPSRLHGFGYSSRTILDPGDVVSPLAVPTAQVAVADLLP